MKFNKLVVSGLLIVSPMLFTACSDDNNRVGRDANVPNNIEDNYTGDADHNRTGENEEEVKRRANELGSDVSNTVARTTDKMSSAVNGMGVVSTDSRMYSSDEYNSLKMRLDQLEKDVMALKSKRVGADIVGQK